jgi:hypothetical protein
MKPTFVYHYTTGQSFKGIVEMGVILPDDQCPDVIQIAGLPGGVWFSNRQDYEPTAVKPWFDKATGKMGRLTFEEMAARAGGAVRIGVDESFPQLLTWVGFRKRCSCRAKLIKNLEEVALRQGSNVNNFRVVLAPVVRGDWATVDVWENGKWVNVLGQAADQRQAA